MIGYKGKYRACLNFVFKMVDTYIKRNFERQIRQAVNFVKQSIVGPINCKRSLSVLMF